MVQMNSTFSNATPHGGQPFTQWKNGFGFGKRSGPGMYATDPSIPRQGRFTPEGNSYYERGSFWRRRYEVGQAAGFGIGDRPTYVAEASIAPNAYGDVAKHLKHARRNSNRSEISLKKRFPTMDEVYRERADPSAGPGPAKYDIRLQPGRASLTHPSKNPRFSMQPRCEINTKIVEEGRKPGPTEYDTRVSPGLNSPVRKGGLYDISLHGRIFSMDDQRQKGPGPGQYQLKSFSDKYNITPGYVPFGHRSASNLDSMAESDGGWLDGEGEDEYEQEQGRRVMLRVPSAPH